MHLVLREIHSTQSWPPTAKPEQRIFLLLPRSFSSVTLHIQSMRHFYSLYISMCTSQLTWQAAFSTLPHLLLDAFGLSCWCSPRHRLSMLLSHCWRDESLEIRGRKLFVRVHLSLVSHQMRLHSSNLMQHFCFIRYHPTSAHDSDKSFLCRVRFLSSICSVPVYFVSASTTRWDQHKVQLSSHRTSRGYNNILTPPDSASLCERVFSRGICRRCEEKSMPITPGQIESRGGAWPRRRRLNSIGRTD